MNYGRAEVKKKHVPLLPPFCSSSHDSSDMKFNLSQSLGRLLWYTETLKLFW